ncbi:MAG TPA: PEP/pyruvate-binding domain-containing protein, partial [Cytophagales bacterium]|nr:PEP/pyruvate-binding domain-containing protein [Cytophagales bacterium]
MYVHPFQLSVAEELAGAKAYHLIKMKAEGFPVPDGVVITKKAFDDFYVKEAVLSEDFKAQLQTHLTKIGAAKYMVRSSAIGEDGANSSFAGQLDSFISGSTMEDILRHLYKCWDSYKKENVSVYEQHQGRKLAGMAVVIQTLIEPDYAGVIFTRSHLFQDQMLVEYVAGHGEQLVSGAVTPTSFHIGKEGLAADIPIPFDFSEGLEVAKNLEKFYGMPLDIEWVIKQGHFQVVQARPITTQIKVPEVYWSNTNVNENYPDAITPLLYSIARDSYYHYFKNLSALFQVPAKEIRALESAYANVIGIFGCHMYYNMTSIHKIISVSPFADALIQSFDNFVGYTGAQAVNRPKATLLRKLKFVKDLVLLNFSLARNVKEFESIVDTYSHDASSAVTLPELRSSFYAFVEIRMHAWYKASLADFFAMIYHGVLGKFCRVFYGEEAMGIHNKLIQAIPNLISSKPIVDTYRIKKKIQSAPEVYAEFKKRAPEDFLTWIKASTEHEQVWQMIEAYLNHWGYRCSGELMLTVENYCEAPAQYIALLQQYAQMPDIDPEQIISKKLEERNHIIAAFKKKIFSRYKLLFPVALIQILVFKMLIRLATHGISARERVRLKQALLYFRFKQTVQKVGKIFERMGLLKDAEDVFFLRHQEIGEALGSSYMLSTHLAAEVALRKEAFGREQGLQYPDDFFSPLGAYPKPEDLATVSTNDGSVQLSFTGLSACGGKVQGRAKVLSS